MKVTAFYDRSLHDLQLDSELDQLIGRRHQHCGIYFPTMRRDITWIFDEQRDAKVAHSKLVNHVKVIEAFVANK